MNIKRVLPLIMLFIPLASSLILSGCQSLKSGPSGQAQCDVSVPNAQPYYPVKAAALRVDGTVTVSYTVGASGHPEDIKILSATPEGYFEREAIRAVSRWCLAPTTMTQTTTLTFRMNDKK
ncbi:energy transducer TonB [Enterobacteriaceae bacterium C23F]